MRSCWSCNTDGENLGCSRADYDPSTPAEMLNKNSRFDNVWSNLIQIPEWETIKPTEFTAREYFTAVSVQESTTSESSSKNPCRHYNSESKDGSMIDPRSYVAKELITRTITSWLQSRCKLITRTITSWLQAVASWLRKHYIIVRCEVCLDCKPRWA